MALPENRNAVAAIHKHLHHVLVGHRYAPKPEMHLMPGQTVFLIPPGDDYPGQEVQWELWTLLVREYGARPEVPYDYQVSITEFLAPSYLDELFESHFGKDIKPIPNPYIPEVVGVERVLEYLPMTVAAKDNEWHTKLFIHWGDESEAAREVTETLNRALICTISVIDASYAHILDTLKSLQPEVFRGGPDPELPFESRWLLDYTEIMNLLSEPNYHYVECESTGIVQAYGKNGVAYGSIVLRFSKIPR
jgi:hypothetical protein